MNQAFWQMLKLWTLLGVSALVALTTVRQIKKIDVFIFWDSFLSLWPAIFGDALLNTLCLILFLYSLFFGRSSLCFHYYCHRTARHSERHCIMYPNKENIVSYHVLSIPIQCTGSGVQRDTHPYVPSQPVHTSLKKLSWVAKKMLGLDFTVLYLHQINKIIKNKKTRIRSIDFNKGLSELVISITNRCR